MEPGAEFDFVTSSAKVAKERLAKGDSTAVVAIFHKKLTRATAFDLP